MPLHTPAPEAAVDAPGGPAPHGLGPDALLALQLVARGYSLPQVAELTGAADAGGVVGLLRRAAEALGAADAVAEARHRGLIV